MNTSMRHSWIIAAGVVAGCLILGLFFGAPLPGQPKPAITGGARNEVQAPVKALPEGALPGRYRLSISKTETMYLLDTTTGQCFALAAGKKKATTYRWEEFVLPVGKK